MKIICVDNFDRESVSDILVCETINEYYGKLMVEFLNTKLSSEYGLNFYKLVENDYKLYKFEP